MSSLASTIGIGSVVFAATNIDDILVVAAFFADPRIRHRFIIAGQFLGIGILVLVSGLAALLALAVPPGWVSLLGLVPLVMGLRGLLALRRGWGVVEGDGTTRAIAAQERIDERSPYSQVFAVAAVTVANGGDNLGVYIPLFATAPAAIPVYAAIFGVMTALLCALGYLSVNNRLLGGSMRRYGHVALPFVLTALGAYLLAGAAVLLR